jgi:hypothetical protein
MDWAEAIDRAIAAHGRWKKRLSDAVTNGKSEFTVEVVRDDSACELGKWLLALPQNQLRSSHQAQVSRLHREFHATAAEILRLALRGARQEAAIRMEFGNDYTLASGKLILALQAWKAGV